jgi:hypothetical protein
MSAKYTVDKTGRLVARAPSTCINLNPERSSGTSTGVPKEEP